MKSITSSILAVGALLFLSVGTAATVSAQAMYTANDKGSTTIAKGETVDGSAYLVGSTIRVSGTVKGDVYCAASSITIDGIVEGDVLCAGNSVTVDGTVNGDVRAAGATVILGGVIKGNATVFGADVTADSSLKLAGDINGAASNLTIDGAIGRDMAVGAGTLTINGSVARDVMTGFGTVAFGKDASVNGNFAYASDTQVNIPEGVVAGETDFTKTEQMQNGTNTAGPIAAVIGVFAIAILAVLGTILLPRQVHAAGDISWGTFGIASVIGLTFIVVAPFAAILFAISGVGIFVAYVLMLLWLLVMALSPVPFIYFVGNKLYGERSPNLLVRTTVGALAVLLVLLLPIVNVIVFIVMVLTGVGMMFAHLPSLYKNSPYQVHKKTNKVAS